ncbi:TolC family protein [Evtepia sp.]|uniref:TolC family protein n=1 Tax=Evtepia sp. TaxID=2773933 RepID=UPI003F140A72
MKTRILSLCLAGVMLLSTGLTASAARVSGSAAPKTTTSHEWAVTPVSGNLSFDQIGGKVRANNLTVKSLDETIQSMEAMNWDKVIDEMEDAIDDLENQIDIMNSAVSNIGLVKTGLAAAFESLKAAEDVTGVGMGITDGIEKLIQLSYMDFNLKNMKSTLESLEDQLDDLKEQKKDYNEKTLPDTKRQIESSVNQIIIGAESLYMTILSTELQKESLGDTAAALDRTVAEMELRYERGQISQMTLTQVKNGVGTLKANAASLDVALTSLYSSLQSLLGETITGTMTLSALPTVTAAEITAVSYTKDLEKAKEASYDLYAAARTVEDAEDDMEDARKENGKNSYQYKMAQHTYEAALLSEKSAVQNFELSFQRLYSQLSPALALCTTAENDLAYEEQVYQVAQLKHQQGNLSANALADAKDTWETAKRDYASAQMDLFTAWNNYQNAVQHGIVSSGS